MTRVLLLLYCLSFPVAIRAEVIDRIMAVVDGHIITASDVRQQHEIRATLGDKPIEDESALLQHLIDDYLIETNITDVTVDVTDGEVDAEMQKFGPGSDLPLAKAREAVRLRIRMRKYFDKRWGESIHPTDEDIRRYYENVFVPAAKERGLATIPTLESIADSIRKNVFQEALNHEIDIWLEAIRRKSKIEIFK
jgi:hypothetical protein